MPDKERTLTARGEADARAMGRWLADSDHVPDVVVCSPAVRAQRTAALACEALGRSPVVDARLYGCGADTYREIAAEHDGTVMIVAHNPTMEDAVRTWTAGPTTPGKVMPSGCIAVLDGNDLVAHQRPGEL